MQTECPPYFLGPHRGRGYTPGVSFRPSQFRFKVLVFMLPLLLPIGGAGIEATTTDGPAAYRGPDSPTSAVAVMRSAVTGHNPSSAAGGDRPE